MNSRRVWMCLPALGLLAAMAAFPLAAQDKEGKQEKRDPKEPNVDKSKKAPPTPRPGRVSEAGYIREMAQNGIATRDPYLLIEAAQMAITVAKQPTSGKATESGPPSVSEEEKKIDLTPAGLLREAVALAQTNGDRKALHMAEELARNSTIGLGDKALADEIAKTEMPRGMTVGSSLRLTGCLAPGQRVDWTGIVFRAGEAAEISVTGSNYTGDIDIYIFDANGNLITSDTRTVNGGWAGWYPYYTSEFIIRLVNRGGSTCYSAYLP